MREEETPIDRKELAAIFAGFHTVIGLLARRLAIEETMDIAELLNELDQALVSPGQHPLSIAVQEDAREVLLGILAKLVCDPDGVEVVREDELGSVVPLRRSPGFGPSRQDREVLLGHSQRGEPANDPE